jgi:hypothetical protein
MKSMTVLSAHHNPETGFIEVAKEVVNDDGSIEYAGQSFHPETVEWLAAIYNTEDMDEIIDFILYEPHVENVDPMSMTADEARKLHKEKIDNFKKDKKKASHNKQVSLQALSRSGVPTRFVDAGTEDPYDVIKRETSIDKSVLIEKKKHAERARSQFKNGQVQDQRSRRSPEQRLASLRKAEPQPSRPERPREEKGKVQPPAILLKNGRRVK